VSERTPQHSTQSDSQDNNWAETEAFGAIHVFFDVVAEPSNEPIPPAVLEWIKQHQYLLQPPKKEGEEEKK
jgi:hypothetical protein